MRDPRLVDATGSGRRSMGGAGASLILGGAKVGEYNEDCTCVLVVCLVVRFCMSAMVVMTDAIVRLTLISPSLSLQQCRTRIQELSMILCSVTLFVFQMSLAAGKSNSWSGYVFI